jgi:hypothetical protein
MMMMTYHIFVQVVQVLLRSPVQQNSTLTHTTYTTSTAREVVESTTPVLMVAAASTLWPSTTPPAVTLPPRCSTQVSCHVGNHEHFDSLFLGLKHYG